ncbi:ABC transporter substrate-binding protein [Nocardioides sp. Kera G14]|uniref:ABC transporter substrate-binding protein n=1 Tax=Nocardioides sp. Kera G14 TaxID=2884264 RepID=UPI001D0FF724|nr:ABC transporter substrate-binding protein [Nocardioides sp. Kera G14]UDY24271.1 ABC transporter substrate-binding protein [Nocardioides sp. Kera G14]
MSARTRRAAGALILMLLPVLAACGGSGQAADPAGSGATRTVTDVEGTSMQVPVHPERVVALSEPTLDGALALGAPLVGTITGRGQNTVPHYLEDRAGDLQILGGVANPNYEAIAKAKPDLILVDGTSINNNPDAIEILRKIAPTFYAGYAGGDWRATFGLVSQALNEVDAGKKVVADYDAAVAAAKKQFGATYAGKTFSIVRWQGGSASVILKELPAGMALDDLGLARPAAQDRRGRGHSEPVSLENLDQIDADYLFFGTLGGSSNGNPDAGGTSDESGAEKALAEAEKVPGFNSLTAVREKHVIPVDGSLWTSTGGPLLMQGLIADVVKALA